MLRDVSTSGNECRLTGASKTITGEFLDFHFRIGRPSSAPGVEAAWREKGRLSCGFCLTETISSTLGEIIRRRNFADVTGSRTSRIVFTDISSNDPQQLQSGEGTYLFIRTPTGIDLRKVQDENSGAPSALKVSGRPSTQCEVRGWQFGNSAYFPDERGQVAQR